MQPSFPQLCCSFASRPSRVGVLTHSAAYRALGLDYTYVAFAVEDVRSAVQALRTLGVRGCGVTMPHKEAIIPYLDHLDPVAARIRAVNTIVNDHGKLTGYNTDWLAAKRALEEVTDLSGKDAVVLGAGGASRAIVYALASSGARVWVYNRTLSRAASLVEEFALAGAHPLDALPQVGQYHILINTTSVGYHSAGETIVPEGVLHTGTVVMDIVAEPLETELLVQAKSKGAQTIPGFRMRLLQAAEQFRLYTGMAPPLEVMEAAMLEATGSQ